MPSSSSTGDTPLMKQYRAIKSKHPNTLLLCRVGDFYETFDQDAVLLSQTLDIVLTKRSNGAAAAVPLAGFPHHALETYLPKLIQAGFRVAVCNQLEDPKHAKGLVKRGVTELITPALSYHQAVLDQKKSRYLASLHLVQKQWGVAFLELSTGDFFIGEGDQQTIERLLEGFAPAEIIFPKEARDACRPLIQDTPAQGLPEWVYYLKYATDKLKHKFGTKHLKGFGVADMCIGMVAAGAILRYLEMSVQQHTLHIRSMKRITSSAYVWMDRFTIRNMELLAPLHEKGRAFIDVIDHTKTAMGARLLRQWVLFPLQKLPAIHARQQVVAASLNAPSLIKEVAHQLSHVGDLARMAGRLAAHRFLARDFWGLSRSLQAVEIIRKKLCASGSKILQQTGAQLETLEPLIQHIQNSLQTDMPVHPRPGDLFKRGYHPEVDQLVGMIYDQQKALEAFQENARQTTGISSLKIGFNKIFGYYLQVRHTHRHKVPSDWIRKQTLVQAERYVTSELKQYEAQIARAEERLIALEKKLYDQFVAQALVYLPALQNQAVQVAHIDIYQSFAFLAQLPAYSLPKVTPPGQIKLTGSCHPVIASEQSVDRPVVPNDIYLDQTSDQILLITGPNMAGKSALLRQVVLNTLLAQIGAPICAKKGTIGVVDQIFTRIGASDNLYRGESTFMVEMQETAQMAHQHTHNSLIILDELGRGTGTADGLALAQSTIEYLHRDKTRGPLTLFATHYHELAHLKNDLKRLQTFHVAVQKIDDKLLFTHQFLPGATPHSLGIEVAQLAGIPQTIVARARQLIKNNAAPSHPIQKPLVAPHSTDDKQLLSKITHLLQQLEIDHTTPIDALLLLRKLITLTDGGLKKK